MRRSTWQAVLAIAVVLFAASYLSRPAHRADPVTTTATTTSAPTAPKAPAAPTARPTPTLAARATHAFATFAGAADDLAIPTGLAMRAAVHRASTALTGLPRPRLALAPLATAGAAVAALALAALLARRVRRLAIAPLRAFPVPRMRRRARLSQDAERYLARRRAR